MMPSNFEDVGLFHRKFNLPAVNNPRFAVADNEVPLDLLKFRADFLQEELDEFNRAVDSDDVPGMFDALIDLVYVALGTAHIMNLPWEAGWDQVQRANMAKVRAAKDGSDSKRGSGWDVVKPDGWRAPDLEAVLQSMGWTADK